MICESCKFDNREGALFCAECGTPLKSQNASTEKPEKDDVEKTVILDEVVTNSKESVDKEDDSEANTTVLTSDMIKPAQAAASPKGFIAGPAPVKPMAPQAVPAGAPQQVRPMAPQGVPVGAPQQARPMAPQAAPAGAPQQTRPMAPQGVPAGAPQQVRPMAQQGVPAGAPQQARPMAPQQGVPAGAPQQTQPQMAAPQGVPAGAPQQAQPQMAAPQAAPQQAQPQMAAPQQAQPETESKEDKKADKKAAKKEKKGKMGTGTKVYITISIILILAMAGAIVYGYFYHTDKMETAKTEKENLIADYEAKLSDKDTQITNQTASFTDAQTTITSLQTLLADSELALAEAKATADAYVAYDPLIEFVESSTGDANTDMMVSDTVIYTTVGQTVQLYVYFPGQGGELSYTASNSELVDCVWGEDWVNGNVLPIEISAIAAGDCTIEVTNDQNDVKEVVFIHIQ